VSAPCNDRSGGLVCGAPADPRVKEAFVPAAGTEPAGALC